MPLYRICLLAVALVACATARNEPRDEPDAAVDAPKGSGSADAAQTGCAQAFTGVLATWDFAMEAGDQASTVVKTTTPGVVAGPVHRAAGLTPVAALNAINSSSWATTPQLELTKYYAFTITPPSGCTLAITMLAVDAKASPTGPTTAAVATSVDSYAQTVAVSTAAASTPSLSIPAQTAPVELRVYGYGASSANGTLRLQTTLSITGSLN